MGGWDRYRYYNLIYPIMFKKLPSVYRLLLFFMLICTGCSIKEDRSGCPCILVLNLSDVDGDCFRFLTVRAESPDGFLFQDIVPVSSLPGSMSIVVPKAEIKVNVFGEALRSVVEAKGESIAAYDGIRPDGSYVIPEYSECPPVYLFAEKVSTVYDCIDLPVSLKKNYCRISIAMLSERQHLFGLNIVGNICGYDVDGKPLPGDFVFSSMIGTGDVSEVSVPRQTDSSLRLQISENGGVVKEFALGEYIAASGYDWSMEELDDISIVIDYIRTRITFRVRDWEKVFEFNVTI